MSDRATEYHHDHQEDAGWVFPVLNFLAFFANFTLVDVHRTSRKYDTLLTPPEFTFFIWLVLWAFQFAFVSYQLFSRKPRSSKLIQRHISLPWLFHQALVLASLLAFSREQIYAFVALITLLWLLSLLTLLLITDSFRSESYVNYSVLDYCLIEIPFALLVGWETMTTTISWNMLVAKLSIDGKVPPLYGTALEFTGVSISVALLLAAAILYAGLPALMSPALHLPMIWGLICLGWRWSDPTASLTREAPWVTPAILKGVHITSWTTALLISLFFGIALAFVFTSRLCLPSRSLTSSMGDEEAILSGQIRDQDGTHRSPRTARSVLSQGRV